MNIIKRFAYLLVLFLSFSGLALANETDTINGYKHKISGDEIQYYSPLHQFASTALLTRANGKMPIQWNAEIYTGQKETVCYELLIGSSSGTSSGIRNFKLSINDQVSILIQTQAKKNIGDVYQSQQAGISYYFKIEDQDINKDVFGKLYIKLPAKLVQQSARFTLNGIDSNSRDWMMVFMYSKKFDVDIQIANLLLKNEKTRRVNVYAINPLSSKAKLKILIDQQIHQFEMNPGYNQYKIAAYDTSKIGSQIISCSMNQDQIITKNIQLYPIKNLIFHIIHHSHNDIGYSHLQSEVEKIQTQNIKDAMNWIESSAKNTSKPYWHIESLWAVENFMKSSTKDEQNKFFQYVKNGQLVLSANYANILTGLCQPQEQNWTMEYANRLRKEYGLPILNIMTTDIPGLSASAMAAYVNNAYPYLSMGPNYVSAQADWGDRVGGMIKEQGDQVFYWKASSQSKEKLLVWTAGKGYSYFHGITDQDKQGQWEKRISDYLIELQQKNYPYDLVQLRYTKNADNGPVDQGLSEFVDKWNATYASPKLQISSITNLFSEFENKYGSQLKELSGEISPYWEDGAYSTAKEEMQARSLVNQAIQIEAEARSKNTYHLYENLFYLLHRSLVLFHEHTWGSWCSISDPEIAFTTEQWKFKKQFVDSAQIYTDSLLQFFPIKANQTSVSSGNISIVQNEIDGGISDIYFNEDKIEADKKGYDFFQVIYSKGINPTVNSKAKMISHKVILQTKEKQIIEQEMECENLYHFKQIYTIYKKQGRIVCRYIFDKKIEKDKESLHLAFNFPKTPQHLLYNNGLEYPSSQLAGSNKEFICVEDAVQLTYDKYDIQIKSPQIALFEMGGIINEEQKNGAKVWKRENQKTNHLFLYVFNNYWHTNYKAYQDGHFDFEVEMIFKKK
ncbi:MAG: hypothetical protein ACOVP1_02300 [Bacteroidia bacterium]